MNNISYYEAQRMLMPELDVLLKKRLRILQAIQTFGPIGRRALAEQLNATEREIRNETTLLSEQQLISIQQKGMICTQQGYEIMGQLKTLFHELSGLAQKEQHLKERFNIEQVIIVAGDVAEDSTILQQLGKEAASILMQNVTANSKVAVTGGSSVAALTNYLSPVKPLNTVQFIAARGGIGDEMSLQANTLVANFAKQCNSTYRSLFLPEHLSEQAYQAMKSEPIVQEMMDLYNEVDVVVHGIGAAQQMAARRNSSVEEQLLLQNSGAVGEAFGYYFNESGEVVHNVRTIGIQYAHVEKSKKVIAIAAGESKAKAIDAYFKNSKPQTILITDERAANEILGTN